LPINGPCLIRVATEAGIDLQLVTVGVEAIGIVQAFVAKDPDCVRLGSPGLGRAARA